MNITAIELKNKLENNDVFLLIDVREEWEFEEVSIRKAKNIPLYSIPENIEVISEKQNEIIVFCRTGVRGNIAKNLLLDAGYKNVRNLEGGFVSFQTL